MQLTEELFVIPHEGEFILYAPLKGAVAKVNGNMIRLLKKLKAGEDIGDLELKLLTDLKKTGITTEGETQIPEVIVRQGFTPTSVTLIPTLDCNLRCIYCYSRAGENAGSSMTLEIAKSAIDFVIENAIAKNEKNVELVFHGGGEPFLNKNMELVKGAVSYFKDQAIRLGLSSRVNATTNGVMSQKFRLEYAIAPPSLNGSTSPVVISTAKIDYNSESQPRCDVPDACFGCQTPDLKEPQRDIYCRSA